VGKVLKGKSERGESTLMKAEERDCWSVWVDWHLFDLGGRTNRILQAVLAMAVI
jgi:hypothetical protein